MKKNIKEKAESDAYETVVASPIETQPSLGAINEIVAKEIQSQGGQTLAFQMDVTSKESIQSVMEKITNQDKKIDTLINNAGTTKWTPLFPGSIEDDTFEKGGLEV